jgi:hypothetical protein
LGDTLDFPPFVGGKVDNSGPWALFVDSNFVIEVIDSFVHLFVLFSVAVEEFDMWVLGIYIVVPSLLSQPYQ